MLAVTLESIRRKTQPDNQTISTRVCTQADTVARLDCCAGPISGGLKEREGHVWINAAGRLQVTGLSCCLQAHLTHSYAEHKDEMKAVT